MKQYQTLTSWKIFTVNMPKKLGLPTKAKPYIFKETEKGYILHAVDPETDIQYYVGMPKFLIENNPHLYSLIKS